MSRPAASAAAAALLVILACASAKTTIEPCAGADTCAALLGYTLYADMKVSEVAALFGADPAGLLAANALDFASPGSSNRGHARVRRRRRLLRARLRRPDPQRQRARRGGPGRAARPRPDARHPLPLHLLQLDRQQPPRRVPLLCRAGRGHRGIHRRQPRHHRYGSQQCERHGKPRCGTGRHPCDSIACLCINIS